MADPVDHQADAKGASAQTAGSDLREAAARPGSILDTFKAVAASFFGVRGGKAHDADVSKLNPVHVVIVGVICAAIFIAILIVAVRFAVGTA